MANIATLTVALAANSAAMIKGLKSSGNAVMRWAQKQRKQAEMVKNFFSGIASGIAMVTKAAAAGAASVVGFATALNIKAGTARELQTMSQVLGVSTTALQEWQYAASKVGIEGDKLTDIFRDTSDKIGDFIQTGGGSAADMFEQLNIKAADFVNLSPDQALLKLAKATERLNQQDKIFFFEAIASDASNLLPLLENNGERLKQMGIEANELGRVLSDNQLNGLAAYGASFGKLLGTIQGFWDQVSASMAPVFTVLTERINEWIERMGGVKPAADAVAGWIVNMALTVVRSVAKMASFWDDLKIKLLVLKQTALDTMATLADFANLSLPSTWFEKAGLLNFADSMPETFAKAMREGIKQVDAEIMELQMAKPITNQVEAELKRLGDDLAGALGGANDQGTEATKGNTTATNTNNNLLQQSNGNMQSLLKGIQAQNDLLGKQDGTGSFGAVNADRIFGTGEYQKQLKSSDSFEGFAKIAADKINSGSKSESNLRQVASAISTLERQIMAYSKMQGYDTKGMQAVVDRLKADAEAMASTTKQQSTAESTQTIFERLKGLAESAQAGADSLKPAVESIAQVTKDGITTTYETTKQGVISITNQALSTIKAAGGSSKSAESASKSIGTGNLPDLGSVNLSMDMNGKQLTTKIFADSRAVKDLKDFVSKNTSDTARSVFA